MILGTSSRTLWEGVVVGCGADTVRRKQGAAAAAAVVLDLNSLDVGPSSTNRCFDRCAVRCGAVRCGATCKMGESCGGGIFPLLTSKPENEKESTKP